MPEQFRQQIEGVSAQAVQPRFNRELARANSAKALTLAEKLKAEQTELARKAALIPPRPKFNQDVLTVNPEPSRGRDL